MAYTKGLIDPTQNYSWNLQVELLKGLQKRVFYKVEGSVVMGSQGLGVWVLAESLQGPPKKTLLLGRWALGVSCCGRARVFVLRRQPETRFANVFDDLTMLQVGSGAV